MHVLGHGRKLIAAIKEGDSVLVESAGSFTFEPVVGFIHVVRGGRHKVVVVSHAEGEFRVSVNHIVFNAAGGDMPAGALKRGDRLRVVAVNGTMVASEVLALRRGVTYSGMFAPLTPSGTLVVDGVVSSAYATPSCRVKLPHSLAHAVLFFARVGWATGIFSTMTDAAAEWLHPFVSGVQGVLHLDKLL